MSVENGFDKPAKPKEEKEKSKNAKPEPQASGEAEKSGKETMSLLEQFSPELRTANLNVEDIKNGKALLHVVNGLLMGIVGMKTVLKPENTKRLVAAFRKFSKVDVSLIEEKNGDARRIGTELNKAIDAYNEVISYAKEDENIEGEALLERMENSWEEFEKIQKELVEIFGHYLSKEKNDEGLLGR